jgi:hypothetical protein
MSDASALDVARVAVVVREICDLVRRSELPPSDQVAALLLAASLIGLDDKGPRRDGDRRRAQAFLGIAGLSFEMAPAIRDVIKDDGP